MIIAAIIALEAAAERAERLSRPPERLIEIVATSKGLRIRGHTDLSKPHARVYDVLLLWRQVESVEVHALEEAVERVYAAITAPMPSEEAEKPQGDMGQGSREQAFRGVDLGGREGR